MIKVHMTGQEDLDRAAMGFGLIQKRMNKIINSSLQKGTQEAEEDLEEATPVASGRLRAGYFRCVKGNEGQVGNEEEHYDYVNLGTGVLGPLGRIIYPQNTKTFKFKSNLAGYPRKFIYPRSVIGHRPRNIDDAIDRARVINSMGRVITEETLRAYEEGRKRTAGLRARTRAQRQ